MELNDNDSFDELFLLAEDFEQLLCEDGEAGAPYRAGTPHTTRHVMLCGAHAPHSTKEHSMERYNNPCDPPIPQGLLLESLASLE